MKRYLPWLIAILILLALLYWLHTHVTFDWQTLAHQLRSASVPYIIAGIVVIYIAFWLRAVRWSILLAPIRKAPAHQLIASQLIGFSAVALIGRPADLARPYLIAKHFKLPLASQLAIYSIERAFDLGAAAILFSVTLALAPHDLPQRATYVKAGIASLLMTFAIVLFAVALRLAGTAVARVTSVLLSPLSTNLASKIAARILDFREGLNTISSFRELLSAVASSLLMWAAIAITYLLSAHAFTDEPTLAHLSFTAVMLLLAISLGASLLQLPIVGWFTQIGANALALQHFFAVPAAPATACAAVILFIGNLAVIPGGLIAARLEGTSLRAAVNESTVTATSPHS